MVTRRHDILPQKYREETGETIHLLKEDNDFGRDDYMLVDKAYLDWLEEKARETYER